MFDNVLLKNLYLFNTSLQKLSENSQKALVRGYGFLEINHELIKLRPYVDNFVLLNNQHMGTNIRLDKKCPDDILGKAEECRALISKLHSAITEKNLLVEGKFDFSSNIGMENLGLWLKEIDSQSAEDAALNYYFLKGSLEAIKALYKNQQQNNQIRMIKELEETEITDKIAMGLNNQGVSLSDEELKSFENAVFEGCESLLFAKKSLNANIVRGTIVDAIGQYLSIDERKLNGVTQKYSDILLNVVDKAKKKEHKNRSILRNVLMLEQSVKSISHENIEKLIYIRNMPDNYNVEESIWDSKHVLPDYLNSYQNDKDFCFVDKQMKYWEEYEEKSNQFNKKWIYPLLGSVNFYHINSIYEDFNKYEEMFLSLQNRDSETVDDAYLGQKNEVLSFVSEMLDVAKYADKYTHLELNTTGVDKKTIERMKAKEELDELELNILGEIFSDMAQKLNDNLWVFSAVNGLEYDTIVDDVLSMPSGVEKIDALNCVNGTLVVMGDTLQEDLDKVFDDLDKSIGVKATSVADVLYDFVDDARKLYPDLAEEKTEDLCKQIKNGVMAAYIVPLYAKKKVEHADENRLAFVDNYDNYSDETKNFIDGVSRYYVEKSLPFYQKDKNNTLLKNEDVLDSYFTTMAGMTYVDTLQDLVLDSLEYEDNLYKKYQVYKNKKSLYELPKNADLMIGAVLYNKKKSR